jgi:hypothetical protein
MTDTDEYRCPNCDSTDLIVIDTRAVADELVECRACLRLHRVEHVSDGGTRLVIV